MTEFAGMTPEVPNTNTKENTIMSTTEASTVCIAVTKDGHACKAAAKYPVQAYVQGMTAYQYNALPLSHQGGGWLLHDIPVCGTHKKVLNQGKALSIRTRSLAPVTEQIAIEFPKEEDNMPTTKKIHCGHCGEYHDSIGQVKACFRPVVKLPMRQSKGVACGNCRKNGKKNPYHPTVQDVKSCYQANN